MKKLLSMITAAAMLICAVYTAPVSADETITISTLAELEAFRDSVNEGDTYEGKIVKLAADIDMSEKYGADKGSWTPIGTKSMPFSGTFEGDEHEIKELYINGSGSDKGLFGYVKYGTIKNLSVSGEIISSGDSVGSIAGYCGISTISGCKSSCAVSGRYYAAGIIGWAAGGSVSNCVNVGTVCAEKGYVGGVVGESNLSSLENCRNSGEISGKDYYTGGVAGWNNGPIANCSNTGNVNGHYITGGISGNNGGTIEYCYNTGSVSATSGTTGGISGDNDNTISDCYNTGTVLGLSTVGGIVGYNGRTVKNCYNTGTVFGTRDEEIGGVAGRHAISEFVKTELSSCYYLEGAANGGAAGTDAEGMAECMTLSDFSDISNFKSWNFESVWKIDALLGRPVLRSQPEITNIIEISTLAELEAFRDSVNEGDTHEGKTVKLTADIDMSEKYGADKGSWTPIGTGNKSLMYENLTNPFSGTFDGQGHKITGLYIQGLNDCAGLFGGIDGTVKNLAVDGIVSGGECIGGIVGGNQGTIEKCRFSGSVSGTDFVGGIAGQSMGVHDSNWNYSHTEIADCYSTAEITASGHAAGGIAGSGGGNDTAARCYNAGKITSEGASDFAGGVYGIADGSGVTDCYYLEGTADRGFCSEGGADPVKALTAAQLADKSSFANWDFENTWAMDNSLGRPVLAYELDSSTTETPIPTETPTTEPTLTPTEQPTIRPTEQPTAAPTTEPTETPKPYNYPYKIVSAKTDNNTAVFSIEKYESASPAQVIFAEYDGGALKRVQIEGILPNEEDNFTRTFEYSGGDYKAFIWDAPGTMTPLAEAWVYKE